MKFHHRPGSTLAYVAVVIASVCFAAAQPSFLMAAESNAAALTNVSWTSSTP